MNSLFQDTKRQLTGDLHELKKRSNIGDVYYITLLRSQGCATWNHPMPSTWHMRHRLATPAVQLTPAVIVTRADERYGRKWVRCI